MCQAISENGDFDPALCPLLADLSPDEIAHAMRTNPRIRACAAPSTDRKPEVLNRRRMRGTPFPKTQAESGQAAACWTAP